MNSNEWQKIKDIFGATLDLPENERADFLNGCDGDLRREVEKLLKANDEAKSFIAEPAFVEAGFTAPDNHDFYVGKQIDSYKILEEIGRGGMGTVYLAARADDFEKCVALKLIKRGMDTSAVLKRFVMERQILANLEHQNIASLLDGGSTAEGLPYLVMEYIEGLPVTKFCDSHGFSIEQRLELFCRICSAVSYAHRNLVVHRDIKPSNILVTEDGVPKLLDFGIAKLLHPDWSLDTIEATATMFRVMTPEYASPEQIRGLPITTASDVYSLGVVLYELLTGERPYKIESRLPDEIAQIVLTEEPLRPSAVVSRRLTVDDKNTNRDDGQTTNPNANSKTGSRKQNPKSKIQNLKSLKGDLDNIILKALRKEPERRYASVQEFAEDIRRHLAGLPVTATADTAFYRFNKFVKRHRAVVLASILITLTLLSATAVTAWQSIVAKRERDRAERRFKQVRQLTNSFLFEFHDSIKDLPGSVASRELVTKKALEYLDNLASEQTDDASLKFELATAYKKVGNIQGRAQSANLGDTKGALESYRKAAEIFEALRQIDSTNPQYRTELAETYDEIAAVNQVIGDYESALKYNQKGLVLLEEQVAADPSDVLSKTNLGNCYKTIGDLTAAKGNLEEALENYRKVLEAGEAALQINPEDRHAKNMMIMAYDAIGTTLGNPNFTNLGDAAGALDAYRKQLDICEKMLANDKEGYRNQHTQAFTLKVIGEVLTATGDWKAALESYEQSFAIFRKLVEADSKDAFTGANLAYLHTNIGEALAETGQTAAALEHHRQAIEQLIKLSETDKENSFYLTYLARAYQRNGDALVKANKIPAALESYQKALASDEQMANEDLENMDIRLALAEDYAKIGKANLMLATNSTNKKIEFIQEARKRFEQSRAVYMDMQAHNLKTNPIKESIANLTKEIARCDEALAR